MHRDLLFAALVTAWLALGAPAFAQAPPGPGADSVEELSLDDLDALGATEPTADGGVAAIVLVPSVPTEHETDRRLLAFPALLAAILAWNVKWKKPARLPSVGKSPGGTPK